MKNLKTPIIQQITTRCFTHLRNPQALQNFEDIAAHCSQNSSKKNDELLVLHQFQNYSNSKLHLVTSNY